MINLKSTIEHESEVLPGVRFTVRVANQFQRAEMEAEIMEEFLQMRELQRQIYQEFTEQDIQRRAAALIEEMSVIMTNGHAETFERARGLIAEYQGLKTETAEVRGASARAGLILEQKIKPATIRHGLMDISGLSVDGDPIETADQFIELAPSELVTEVFTRCQEAATLTPDQSGNWRSLGGSGSRTAGAMNDSTVEAAGSEDTTESAIAGSGSRPI